MMVKLLLLFLVSVAFNSRHLNALRPADPPSVEENKGYLHQLTTKSEINADVDYRLPLTVTPIHYLIRVKPQIYDMAATDFLKAAGRVVITVRSIGENDTITLHRDPIAVVIDEANVVVRKKGGESIGIKSQTYDDDKHFYIIGLSSQLVKDQEYEIEIPYNATLSDTTKETNRGPTNGIFAAAYTTPEGEKRWLAATHFEPARARKAFPGFDEPNLKAQFELIIGRKTNPYHSLSNMELNHTEADPESAEWEWDYYNPSQVMSSYLVCFAVSDFESVTADTALYGKPVKIWAAPYLIAQKGGEFAAQAAAKVLQYFNQTLGVDYKLPKMDAIAVPPFGGAMENWGLNVYGESALLYIPGKSTVNNKRSISNVIAHELAHQWFGNLVTCAWWSDIWLNEGFATYMSFQAEHAVTPDLEPLERIYLDVIPASMGFDHGASTHPVKSPVDNPVTGAKFDTMVYEKGAAIIRMMEYTFGREKFFQGLTQYLNDMSYQPAEQDDLFARLQLIANESLPADITVKNFLESWTLQSGYPVVRVSKVSDNTLYLSQERYIADKSLNQSGELTQWNIPIRMASASNPTVGDVARDWIRHDQVMKPVTSVNTNEWIVVNPDGAGYYRVLYDEDLLRMLWAQLNSNHSAFSTTTRAKFMDDYFNFATAGYTDVEKAMEFTRYLGKEVQRVPWSIFLIHFARFAELAEDNPGAKNIIQRYLSPRFDELLANIGREQEADATGHKVILRNAIFERACPLRYSGCLEYGNQVYQQWKNSVDGTNPTPLDLRTVLYCGAVAGPNGDAAVDFFLEKYRNETDANHKSQLLSALGCSNQELTHSRLIQLAEDPNSGLEAGHRVTLLQRMTGESAGRDLVLDYIKTNLNSSLVTPQAYSSVIAEASKYIYTDVRIQKIETHVNQNAAVLQDVLPSLRSSISKMKANAEWMGRVGSRAITWMSKNLNY